MNTHTGRLAREDEGRVQGDASTSQGTPKIASSHQKLRVRHGTVSFSQSSEGMDLANTLISDFHPPEI